ncbi:MAG TPA: hypothetical protein VFA26_13490, partial [Gemmataceae bacterium]|nr:hypothetical protein [Gemmataceae bacterium]
MVRIARALALAAGLALAAAAWAADEGPAASNWKVVSLNGGQRTPFWLIKLEMKDGQPAVSVLSRAQGLPPATVGQVSSSGGRLRFTIKMGKDALTFDGKMPAEGDKTVLGSLGQEDHCIPAELERTTLKTLADPYEVAKDRMARLTKEPEVFFLALQLLGGAAENKAKPEEVRGWAEKAYKAAEPYGVRWQREMAALIADELAQQDGFGAVAVAYAQRAERLLEPKDPGAIQVRVLKTLAAALKKADKADDAKEVQARIDRLEKDAKAAQEKLDAKLDEEYLKKGLPFKP